VPFLGVFILNVRGPPFFGLIATRPGPDNGQFFRTPPRGISRICLLRRCCVQLGRNRTPAGLGSALIENQTSCMQSSCCVWPRGTGFPQLPSAVTSTVDRPLDDDNKGGDGLTSPQIPPKLAGGTPPPRKRYRSPCARWKITLQI
jgi:hypothetical protein